MINNIVKDMSREHRQDFHIVRLNGFIHTDDKLALKEIWRQLGKEMQVDDDLLTRVSASLFFFLCAVHLLLMLMFIVLPHTVQLCGYHGIVIGTAVPSLRNHRTGRGCHLAIRHLHH